MVEVFAEYGAIGVMLVLFGCQILFLQRTLMGKLLEIEDMTIKLIDRINSFDQEVDRRHDDVVRTINKATDDINYLKGRINGK